MPTSRTATTTTRAIPKRYEAPKSSIGLFLWRKKMWVEATFALSMLEGWEKFLVVLFFVLVLGLCLVGAISYLPQHVHFITRRARYYLLGNEKETFYMDWATKAEL